MLIKTILINLLFCLIYIFVVIPLGILIRVIGFDYMGKNPNKKTYWRQHDR